MLSLQGCFEPGKSDRASLFFWIKVVFYLLVVAIDPSYFTVDQKIGALSAHLYLKTATVVSLS